MIIGIGTDVVEIARVRKLIERETAISKMFTENEKVLLQSQSSKEQWAAGRFATKEAASKALKAGIAKCPLNQIEVLYDQNGAPTLSFIGKAKALLPQGNIRAHITITHDFGIATATVIVEKLDEDIVIKDLEMAKEITCLLPERPNDSHKGDMGHVVILAGSKRYTGAGYLSAIGALKGGAGLVTWCKSYKATMSPPEAMNYPLTKIGGIEAFINFAQDLSLIHI
jgi:holo-[acyl-carrier-protein] synthase